MCIRDRYRPGSLDNMLLSKRSYSLITKIDKETEEMKTLRAGLLLNVKCSAAYSSRDCSLLDEPLVCHF